MPRRIGRTWGGCGRFGGEGWLGLGRGPARGRISSHSIQGSAALVTRTTIAVDIVATAAGAGRAVVTKSPVGVNLRDLATRPCIEGDQISSVRRPPPAANQGEKDEAAAA